MPVNIYNIQNQSTEIALVERYIDPNEGMSPKKYDLLTISNMYTDDSFCYFVLKNSTYIYQLYKIEKDKIEGINFENLKNSYPTTQFYNTILSDKVKSFVENTYNKNRYEIHKNYFDIDYKSLAYSDNVIITYRLVVKCSLVLLRSILKSYTKPAIISKRVS